MPQTDVHDRFIQRLKQARKAVGLSQAALGLEVGLPEETASTRINRYERGTSEPDLRTAEAMAKALGVSLSYLVAPDEATAKLLLALETLPLSQREQALAMIEALAEEKAAAKRAKKNSALTAKKLDKATVPATSKARRRTL